MNELTDSDPASPPLATGYAGGTEAAQPEGGALFEDAHLPLRLWLRLLTCSKLIENHLGQRLKQEFGSSLPRFDLLAQLHRFPEGLRMNALSRRLMVTGGSVTGLADQLERDGLLQRQPVEGDRRATLLRLTPVGRQRFEAMAREHEQWVSALFEHVLPAERQSLYKALGRLREGLQPPVKPPPRSSG